VNRFDEINRMVVGNKLQRVLDALNDVLFLYGDGQCLNSFVGTSGELSCSQPVLIKRFNRALPAARRYETAASEVRVMAA
jgi:hypothetical protein